MTFFLDLWHDLREKRLWPVAVGLLAAAFAIPLILLKPASESAPAPAVVAKANDSEVLPAVRVDTGPAKGSKLETFSAHNPFKPLKDLDQADSPSGDTTITKSQAGSSPSASSASSSKGSGSGAGSPSTSSGGSSPGGGSSSGGSTPSGTTPSGPSVQWFRYTADIRFGTPDKMETRKDVKSLSLLPDDIKAAIVFMGVTDDAKGAVFFISDPAFTADGEGKCNDKKTCRFITLTLSESGNEETFTSQDGTTSYDLKLLKLNRENVSSSQAKGDATDAKPKSKHKAASGAVKVPTEDLVPRLLFLPGIARETK